jgi:hypothetical protein
MTSHLAPLHPDRGGREDATKKAGLPKETGPIALYFEQRSA